MAADAPSVLDHNGWRCQRFGRPGALEVHHRDGGPGATRRTWRQCAAMQGRAPAYRSMVGNEQRAKIPETDARRHEHRSVRRDKTP